jgi:hypothetical protein
VVPAAEMPGVVPGYANNLALADAALEAGRAFVTADALSVLPVARSTPCC